MKQRIFQLLVVSLVAILFLGVWMLPASGYVSTGQIPTGTNDWTWRGPQWNSAEDEAPDVIQILIDPSNPSIVYAGTNQGVYRSTDGGETWEPRNGGLGGYGDLVISGLVRHPTDPQTLIIGTWGYGLFRSTDSGANWTRLTDPLQPTAQLSAVGEPEPPPVRAGGYSYSYGMVETPKTLKHPLPAGLLLAVHQQEREEPQDLPRSLSWTPVRRVAINPGNANEILACIDADQGLYRTTNGGASWTKVDLGTGSARTYTFAPSNSQIRYASFGSWGTSGGFYRTTNGGGSWEAVGAGTINGTVIAVAIHPTNPNIVLVGTSGDGAYRSTDGGNSWTKVSSGLTDSTYFSVAFAPSNPSVAYMGGYEWIYRSTDGGATWANADSSFPTYYVEGLAIHPTQPETVLVGANFFPWGGLYKRTSSDASFALKSTGMRNTFVLSIEQDPTNSNTLYAATWGAGVFRSDDGGESWSARYSVPYVYALEATQGPTGTILYAGTFYSNYGVLKSYDQGDTWIEVSWGYDSDISFDLESIYDDPNWLVAATYDGIQYSTDGGQSWYDASGLDTGVVLRLSEFPGTGRLLATTYGGGLFYSWGGYSWYEANTGVANQYTYDVACSPNTAGLAYAGGLGVYRTTDYGEHWQLVNAGLPNDYIRAIDIVPGTGDVFAGSHQNGVYLAPQGSPVWFAINSSLTEKRIRTMKVVSSSPVRAFAGTNGEGTWDYTLTSRPAVTSLYLPLVLKQHVSVSADTYEPNGSFSQAYPIASGTDYNSCIWTDSDEDYYRLNITTLGNIVVDLTNIPAGTDYDLELYDGSYRLAGYSWRGSNHDEHIVFSPIRTGSYYLKVYSYSGSSQSQAYRLRATYNGAVPSGSIYGTVTDNGSSVSNVLVELRYSNGYRSVTAGFTQVDSGTYRFRGMPALPIGHYYQVQYNNWEDSTNRLAYWYCYAFSGYASGETRPGGNFDVADVKAVSPAHGASVSLPVTFSWTRRNVTSDSYALRLRSPDWSLYWESGGLGYSSSYVLTSLPPGFDTGVTYRWDVLVYGPDGYGIPYYYRNITFTTLGESEQAGSSEPGIPNGEPVRKEEPETVNSRWGREPVPSWRETLEGTNSGEPGLPNQQGRSKQPDAWLPWKPQPAAAARKPVPVEHNTLVSGEELTKKSR